MSYEIEIFSNGKSSIKNSALGESMHSSIGHWEEANLIYIEQSRLEKRLSQLDKGPLVVYDVGLGIAANALALIAETLKISHQQKSRDLHLISFENDLKGLKLALDNKDYFQFLRENHDFVKRLESDFLTHKGPEILNPTIEYESPSGSKIKWELHKGDFPPNSLKSLPIPELIYFDFYSPKSSPDLWNFKMFSQICEITKLNQRSSQTTTLLTYTSSTSVRSAMVLAGFKVGYGIQTAAKFETTIASTERAELSRPLGQEWIDHLNRSSKPVPTDHNYATQADAVEAVIKIVKTWDLEVQTDSSILKSLTILGK